MSSLILALFSSYLFSISLLHVSSLFKHQHYFIRASLLKKNFSQRPPLPFPLICTGSLRILKVQNGSKRANLKAIIPWMHEICVNFFVLIGWDQTSKEQRKRLLDFFDFISEFADIFNFFLPRPWLSWREVLFPVNWVNTEWDSPLTESTQSETLHQLSQRGMMQIS